MILTMFYQLGDNVLIQQPVYHPFADVVHNTGRELVVSPWKRDENGYYTMDFADFEEKAKDGLTLKEAKRIDRKIRTLHSKTAAYYLLGNWAIFIRPLWAIRWRLLDLKDSEVTYSINAMGANNRGVDFFLANWQITKVQLALSTRLVGKGIKQYEERMESAEGMLREDGLETSQDSR